MKSIIKAIAGLVGVVALVVTASAQPVPYGPFNAAITNTSGTVISNILYIAGSGTATVNSDAIPLYRKAGIGLAAYAANTNANTTDALTFTLQPGIITSVNGSAVTNWMNIPTTTWAPVIGGVTGQWGYTNLSTANVTWFDNFNCVRITTIANAHASSVFITNLLWSAFP